MRRGGAAEATLHFGALRQVFSVPRVPLSRSAHRAGENTATDVARGYGHLRASEPLAGVARGEVSIHGRGGNPPVREKKAPPKLHEPQRFGGRGVWFPRNSLHHYWHVGQDERQYAHDVALLDLAVPGVAAPSSTRRLRVEPFIAPRASKAAVAGSFDVRTGV